MDQQNRHGNNCNYDREKPQVKCGQWETRLEGNYAMRFHARLISFVRVMTDKNTMSADDLDFYKYAETGIRTRVKGLGSPCDNHYTIPANTLYVTLY